MTNYFKSTFMLSMSVLFVLLVVASCGFTQPAFARAPYVSEVSSKTDYQLEKAKAKSKVQKVIWA